MTETQAKNIIEDWNAGYSTWGGKRLLIQRLEEKLGGQMEVAKVLDVISKTCHYCWNADSPCHCMNDE